MGKFYSLMVSIGLNVSSDEIEALKIVPFFLTGSGGLTGSTK